MHTWPFARGCIHKNLVFVDVVGDVWCGVHMWHGENDPIDPRGTCPVHTFGGPRGLSTCILRMISNPCGSNCTVRTPSDHRYLDDHDLDVADA